MADLDARKVAEAKYQKEYYEKNKEKLQDYHKNYYENHKEELKQSARLRQATATRENKDHQNELKRKRYHEDEGLRKRRSSKSIEWQKKNPEKGRAKAMRYHVEHREEILPRMRESAKARYNTLEGRLEKYIENAEKRGFEWSLSDEEAIALFREDCHYCDSKGDPLNGIDRKDNRKGYTEENTLPCCSWCNRAKGPRSYEDFLDYLDRVQRNPNRYK